MNKTEGRGAPSGYAPNVQLRENVQGIEMKVGYKLQNHGIAYPFCTVAA